MNLLLDTHALLWWLSDDPRLGSSARKAVASPDNLVATSAATGWEISTKTASRKLEFNHDLAAVLEANGVRPLPITLEHAIAAGRLPLHHKDPFDRMLIAQALAEGMTVITHDRRFQAYGVPVLAA